MNQNVKTLILFTLTACPMGRNMGNVIEEVADHFPAIEIATVFVEIDIKNTNRYKVKTNPTLLFLDANENELYRLEGFHETSEVIRTIIEINENKLVAQEEYEENEESVEDYTIYLLEHGKPSPVKVKYRNETSIKAPRITAVNLLLQTQISEYDNPFLYDSTLLKIDFEDTKAYVTIKKEVAVTKEELRMMEILIQKTLEKYGINEVNLSITQ